MTTNESALTATRHRRYLVTPPGTDTLPDLRDGRERFFTNNSSVRVSPTQASGSEPIKDASGRIVAPPQDFFQRAPGPWDRNQVSA